MGRSFDSHPLVEGYGTSCRGAPELSYCLHNSQNRQSVGVLKTFSRGFWPFSIGFGMDFRFESQERHNGQPTQPLNEVWSHVPSRRSMESLDMLGTMATFLGGINH